MIDGWRKSGPFTYRDYKDYQEYLDHQKSKLGKKRKWVKKHNALYKKYVLLRFHNEGFVKQNICGH